MFDDIERIAQKWGLNECETGDLTATAEVLFNTHGLQGETLVVHLEMRAEVLKLVGSSVQELWDGFEKLGDERRDAGKGMAS